MNKLPEGTCLANHKITQHFLSFSKKEPVLRKKIKRGDRKEPLIRKGLC